MTRARALKTVIRARVVKTGERYTTARRHALKSLQVHNRYRFADVDEKAGLYLPSLSKHAR